MVSGNLDLVYDKQNPSAMELDPGHLFIPIWLYCNKKTFSSHRYKCIGENWHKVDPMTCIKCGNVTLS